MTNKDNPRPETENKKPNTRGSGETMTPEAIDAFLKSPREPFEIWFKRVTGKEMYQK